MVKTIWLDNRNEELKDYNIWWVGLKGGYIWWVGLKEGYMVNYEDREVYKILADDLPGYGTLELVPECDWKKGAMHIPGFLEQMDGALEVVLDG